MTSCARDGDRLTSQQSAPGDLSQASTSCCQQASETVRWQFNQALFEGLYIDDDYNVSG